MDESKDEEKFDENGTEMGNGSNRKEGKKIQRRNRSRSRSKTKKLLDDSDAVTTQTQLRPFEDNEEEKGDLFEEKHKKKKKKKKDKKNDDDSISTRSEPKNKQKPNDEKIPLNNESNPKSLFGRLNFGFAPVRQSIDDREGVASGSCTAPWMSEDVIDDHLCLSRDECSWMCCRSEKLGNINYNAQKCLCVPVIYSKRCFCSYLHCCFVALGDTPCAKMTGLGLRKQQPSPKDSDQLEKARDALSSQHKGMRDDICLIRVIGCDRPLLERVSVLHPMVRVHLVNVRTGLYLKKKVDTKDGGATTTYESSSVFYPDNNRCSQDSVDSGNDSSLKCNEKCDVLLPVSTSPFPLGRCMEPPRWEGKGGDLLINEPYSTILDPETLLLVEISDFSSAKSNTNCAEKGFVGIAWGFLMPVSRNGRPCIGVRGGSISDEKLGATPRDARQLSGHHRANSFAEADLESKRLTLQLFHWNNDIDLIAMAQARHRGLMPIRPPATSLVPAVYLQWFLRSRRQYPVTLALRIGPISQPHTQYIEHRPVHCLQVERGAKSKDQHLGAVEEEETEEETPEEEVDAQKRTSNLKINESVAKRLWTPGSKCALPNKLLLRQSLGSGGASSLAYSHCGRWLAVATGGEEGKCPIVVFDLNEEVGVAKLSCTLRGHVSLVHDLDWSVNDHFLVSASRDGSAIVWSLESLTDNIRKKRKSLLGAGDVLPASPTQASATPRFLSRQSLSLGAHPTTPASPRSPRSPRADVCPMVVTGGFDGSVLLWDPCLERPNLGFLGAHQTALHRFSVTAIFVEHHNRRIFSGDSDGVIWSWVAAGSAHGTTPKQSDDTKMFVAETRPINHTTLKGRTITSIQAEPSHTSIRKRCSNLLVAAHGNLVLLFDSDAKALLAQFHGALLNNSPIRARFSPDGRFVLSGSEDGRVVVWKANTSDGTSKQEDLSLPIISRTKKACTLSGLVRFGAPLLDVCWNPKQHCVALVAAGGSFPLLVAYTDTPLTQEIPQKPAYLNDNVYFSQTLPSTAGQENIDTLLSGGLAETGSRSKQILRTLAKARLSELRTRQFESPEDTSTLTGHAPAAVALLDRGDGDSIGVSEEQVPRPQATTVDSSFH